jgi:hypothetical protein
MTSRELPSLEYVVPGDTSLTTSKQNTHTTIIAAALAAANFTSQVGVSKDGTYSVEYIFGLP